MRAEDHHLIGRVSAANHLRDSFRRDGMEQAAIVCSNYACFAQVEAGATFAELQEQGSSDLAA